MSKREIGVARVKAILGENAPDIIDDILGGLSPDFANYIYDFTYGELYARNHFPDKILEVAAVSALLGQRNFGLPLKSHFKAMMNVGWEKKDIIELLLFLSNYVGFPAIVEAFGVLREVLKEVSE